MKSPFTIGQLVTNVWGSIVAVASRTVNPTLWRGDTIPAPTVTGEPLVDTAHWRGSQPNVLIGGRVDANAQVVGDKTGYTLTAGSYSIRASSVQRGTSGAANVQADITVSAVTMTRAVEGWCGAAQNSNTAVILQHYATMQLVSTTVVRHTVTTLVNNQITATVLPEYF